MPVQIGVKAHNFSEPTGLLCDCHRRIEMFLGALEAVAEVINEPLTKEAAHALESALRYFREAAPKHTADEEESLLPRLHDLRHPDARSVLARLEALEEEHRWAGPLHAEVDKLGEAYLKEGSLPLAEAAKFRKAVASLVSMYKCHIRIEDEIVFPLATQLLSQADKAAIAQEMAARRQVKVVAAISDLRE